MNTPNITGSWTERIDKLRQKFRLLTNSDLKFEEGKKAEMLVKLQTKLGKTKEELLKIITAL